MSRPGEDDLIATYFAPFAGEGALGLRDDAALLRPPPGHELVVTVDALVAGVHFFPDDPAESIGVKALGVNLSDLAAKGATPLGFLLALALPDDWSTDWLRAFCDGLARMAADHGCPLLGGDTVRTPGPLTLSITALGSVPIGRMVRRTGARPGDILFVSGTIGDGALGLVLRSGPSNQGTHDGGRDFLLDRYLHPRPRGVLVPALLAYATGAMDVSDGLLGDAAKMLAASGVSGRLDLGCVPLSAPAQAAVAADPAVLVQAVTGGDDYEILASIPPAAVGAFTAMAAATGIPVTAVGQVDAGSEPMRVTDASGQVLDVRTRSFSHF